MDKNIITGLQHIGIPTKRIEETLLFYKELGFQVKMQTELEGTGKRVVFVEKGNLVLEFYESNMLTKQNGAINHICLNVTDIEEMFHKVSNTSFILVDSEIRKLPFWDYGIAYFNVLGPNEEQIEFCKIL